LVASVDRRHASVDRAAEAADDDDWLGDGGGWGDLDSDTDDVGSGSYKGVHEIFEDAADDSDAAEMLPMPPTHRGLSFDGGDDAGIISSLAEADDRSGGGVDGGGGAKGKAVVDFGFPTAEPSSSTELTEDAAPLLLGVAGRVGRPPRVPPPAWQTALLDEIDEMLAFGSVGRLGYQAAPHERVPSSASSLHPANASRDAPPPPLDVGDYDPHLAEILGRLGEL